MNFQRQFGEITSENTKSVWDTAFSSLALTLRSGLLDQVSSALCPIGFKVPCALGICEKVIEFIRLYIRLFEFYGLESHEDAMLRLVNNVMGKLDSCRIYVRTRPDRDYFEDPISQKQNTLFELGSEIRTHSRTRSMKVELLEMTWNPSRYLDWCVPLDEKEFIQSQFVREETCHTILQTGKRKGKYCGRNVPCRYHV
jgi:hypothetical protein